MVYSNFNKITKQWWGATHFRIGSRNQPRPNKGFKLTQLDSIGKTVEYFRWWKRLRRGNIANAINSIKNDENNIVKSGDIEKLERGEIKMPKENLSIIYKYLGINIRQKEKRRYI
ncbi:hypothetical protein MACJ_002683 [Theileria orientalis]|uniref:Uncharacterized protein n=1 Tax=Theileria orientalis TaxID=68886 RepID=A0A976M6K5_THEOR|nr:hypothetical protein MACJ_002683 [Theileria orientalis]